MPKKALKRVMKIPMNENENSNPKLMGENFFFSFQTVQ